MLIGSTKPSWTSPSSGGRYNFLASPVTGGGTILPWTDQFILMGYLKHGDVKEKIAEEAWTVLQMHNQKLVVDGKALDSPEDNKAELIKKWEKLKDQRLPVLKRRQVLPT